jgi:enoyl-CoA hydratase/carnithine racemase
MDKVRFETSGSLGILTLTNPPLNLFSGELIEDLRAVVTTVKRASLRALLVQAEGKIFSGGADVSIF